MNSKNHCVDIVITFFLPILSYGGYSDFQSIMDVDGVIFASENGARFENGAYEELPKIKEQVAMEKDGDLSCSSQIDGLIANFNASIEVVESSDQVVTEGLPTHADSNPDDNYSEVG